MCQFFQLFFTSSIIEIIYMYQRKINELLDFMYCVKEKKYMNIKKYLWVL